MFYIIDNQGQVHGEAHDRNWLELHMGDIIEYWLQEGKTQEEIDSLELEIIEEGIIKEDEAMITAFKEDYMEGELENPEEPEIDNDIDI